MRSTFLLTAALCTFAGVIPSVRLSVHLQEEGLAKSAAPFSDASDVGTPPLTASTVSPSQVRTRTNARDFGAVIIHGSAISESWIVDAGPADCLWFFTYNFGEHSEPHASHEGNVFVTLSFVPGEGSKLLSRSDMKTLRDAAEGGHEARMAIVADTYFHTRLFLSPLGKAERPAVSARKSWENEKFVTRGGLTRAGEAYFALWGVPTRIGDGGLPTVYVSGPEDYAELEEWLEPPLSCPVPRRG
jgi:hypothetical protein